MLNYLRGIGLNARILIAAALLVLLGALSVEIYFVSMERQALDLRLREKVAFINNYYAQNVSEALFSQDDVVLQQSVSHLEEDQEIASVIVADQNSEVRYNVEPEKVGTTVDDKDIQEVLKTGDGILKDTVNAGGKALLLVCPLKIRGKAQPIGALRIEMTYRAIAQRLDSQVRNFAGFLVGTLLFCVGAARVLAGRWIILPLRETQAVVKSLNSFSEPNLPESEDEFGRINRALNEFVVRIRAELQQHEGLATQTEANEKRLLGYFLDLVQPEARMIVADRDNRILIDTALAKQDPKRHLLDLIADTDFANLVGNAFQKEGTVVQGPVSVQDRRYEASIFRIPTAQSLSVKTLITLKPIA